MLRRVDIVYDVLETGGAGGAPKPLKKVDMNASKTLMSHVSICFSTRPSLLMIYFVDPV